MRKHFPPLALITFALVVLQGGGAVGRLLNLFFGGHCKYFRLTSVFDI